MEGGIVAVYNNHRNPSPRISLLYSRRYVVSIDIYLKVRFFPKLAISIEHSAHPKFMNFSECQIKCKIFSDG